MNRVLLLVEDNATDEKLTLRAFKKNNLGNEVVVTRDGQEALDYLFDAGPYAASAPNPPPALVLLDLKLPRIEGLEVLRRIRADPRTRLLPVVVLTSSAEDEDLMRSYSLGANAYVRKPVDFARFIEAARTLGLFWMLHNEPPPEGGTP
ncbi:MAG TPA: response regulator [Kofleriaceae bacterium]|jgi:two-component system response regulator